MHHKTNIYSYVSEALQNTSIKRHLYQKSKILSRYPYIVPTFREKISIFYNISG